MTAVPGQRRLLRELLGALRPHWRRDRSLPARIERLLRRDRRAGSRDRRLQRELLYTALRYLPWIEPLLDSDPARAEEAIGWLAADVPATRDFRAAVAAGWPPCPADAAGKAAVLGADPEALLPGWLGSECPEAAGPAERDVLLSRAPLWLRLAGPDPGAVLDEFRARGWDCRQSGWLPAAVSIRGEADATSTAAYRAGLFEVQDLGSQFVLESVGVAAGGLWLDGCAGAGGKTLQLAGLLGPSGRIEAHDIRPAALAELGRRAARAGLAGRIAVCERPRGPYDGVLVDAPCSGSGTWRRSPHLRATTGQEDLAGFARTQLGLLERFGPFVRPGGRLVYATCSLCRTENEEVVRAFLAKNRGFVPAPFARSFSGRDRDPGLLFLPSGHDGDGFYVASLVRL
jgi:16S rRNA (cytosine967-C5)-methyltransferase